MDVNAERIDCLCVNAELCGDERKNIFFLLTPSLGEGVKKTGRGEASPGPGRKKNRCFF